MIDQSVKPERITKPIQLLAAWLAGLLAMDSCFLFSAVHMNPATWHASALVIAAIANVPVFLGAVFLLQTRFRPELQEDAYYSTYLNAKTNQPVSVSSEKFTLAKLQEIDASLSKLSLLTLEAKEELATSPDPVDLSDVKFGINFHLENVDEIQRYLSKEGVRITQPSAQMRPRRLAGFQFPATYQTS